MSDSGPAFAKHTTIAALAIVVLTLVTYAPILGAGFIWDDNLHVSELPAVLEPGGFSRIWTRGGTPQYYPIVYSTFRIEHALWGLNPTGYHVVNVLLHALNALIVWRLARLLRLPGAWMIAAIFAVHTVHVESVAWISERKNVLSGFFYLLAMWCGLRFDDAREGGVPAWRWYSGTIALFALALLSKSVTCSLPAALILLMVYRRRPLTFQRLLPLAPLFVIGAIAALNTAAMERVTVGAVGAEWDASFIDRTLIATRALLFYPWKLLWPNPVMFVYPRWTIDAASWRAYWSLIPVLAAAAASIALLVRGRRGPFVALAFFAGTVFPAIGYFNVYPHRFSFVADHFQYLASLGILALVVGAVATALRRAPRVAPIALSTLALVVLAGLSWRQVSTYRSAESVWRDTLAKNDASWMPHTQMALIRLRDTERARAGGDEAGARAHLEAAARHAARAVELKPDSTSALGKLAESLRLLGRPAEALVHQERAVAIMEERYGNLLERPPFHAEEYLRLARIHDRLDQLDDAIAAYERARRLRPDEPFILGEIAFFHRRRGRTADARHAFEALLAVDPTNHAAHTALGLDARAAGLDTAALHHFEAALSAATTPDRRLPALMNLIEFLTESDPPRAVTLAEAACAETGRAYPQLLDLLAGAYAAAGRNDDAARTRDEARELARRLGLEE